MLFTLHSCCLLSIARMGMRSMLVINETDGREGKPLEWTMAIITQIMAFRTFRMTGMEGGKTREREGKGKAQTTARGLCKCVER